LLIVNCCRQIFFAFNTKTILCAKMSSIFNLPSSFFDLRSSIFDLQSSIFFLYLKEIKPILMRNIFLLLLFVFMLAACGGGDRHYEIKVMSFNIRFDNPQDVPNHWSARLPLVERYLNDEMPDIMGVQEALYHQNEDILRILPGYAYVGTGRDDGQRGGEFSSLFFRTDVFELLEHSQFWLSENPHTPGSIGWEAILPRVVAWAHLRHKHSGQNIFVFNTHYSHVSDMARRRSMEFMSGMMKEIAGEAPVIVTGDFNIRKGSSLYNDMVDHFYRNNLLQSVALAPGVRHSNQATFNGFNDQLHDAVIDYIFVSPHFVVKSYDVDLITEDEVYISDHWPVKATVKLNK
jgi:endonuclease/exonuclease/phosphatase family metal-dependent hydrolase